MGFMDELKKIIHPYDDEDYDYEEEELEQSEKSDSRSIFDDRREERKQPEDRHNKVVNIHATAALKVVLVKPERFENASEIADHLREKRTVVMNLESTNKDVARRLIDFLSGVAYAGDGKIKKVAANTYIITPYSVDIMGDLIDELENNGLYLEAGGINGGICYVYTAGSFRKSISQVLFRRRRLCHGRCGRVSRRIDRGLYGAV